MKPEAAMTEAKQLLSDELLHQIEESARAQNRKPSEVLEEAVRKYLDEESWQTLVGKAEERNRANGLAEEDVPRLVSEMRRENERGR
jgi:predicted transcriptional regulator